MSAIAGRPSHWIEFEAVNPSGKPPPTAHKLIENTLKDDRISIATFKQNAPSKLLRKSSKASHYAANPFVTQAVRDALLKAARADELPMMQFWFATGLRPGELMALRWDRIGWVGSKVRIDLNLVSKTEKDPKTEAGIRDVNLNPAALHAQKPASFPPNAHVWLNPRTNTAWEADAQISKTLWQPLCTRAGVRFRNPYHVRHTFASSLLTAGENPWYVASQLGHVDVQLVFKVYGKFIPQDYQRPTGRLMRAGNE